MFLYDFKNNRSLLNESSMVHPDKIDDPVMLNKTLNKFDYGLIDTHGKKTSSVKEYRTLTPNDFVKYKCGICWDYCAYEDYWFAKHGYQHSLYFMVTNKATVTHTFLVYKDDTYNIFESSWKSNKGIHKFRSKSEAISDYFKKFKDRYKSDKYVLYEYKQPRYNLTDEQFLDYIFEHGRLLKET